MMKPLQLLAWVAERLTVLPARKMSDYRDDRELRRLDFGAFSELELTLLRRELALSEESDAHGHWREAINLLDMLLSVEPMPREVVETRDGYRLAHPTHGTMTAEWCLAQAAGFLRAALAINRGETILLARHEVEA